MFEFAVVKFAVALESSNDNPRSDADVIGEANDGRLGEVTFLQKLVEHVRRDQSVRREGVRLGLAIILIFGKIIEPSFLRRMQQDVTKLVKEVEPKMVVRIVPKAQFDDRPIAEPECRT